jgi:hypothetical protein
MAFQIRADASFLLARAECALSSWRLRLWICVCIGNSRRYVLNARELRDRLAEQACLRENLRNVRRAGSFVGIFITMGIILIEFGYTLYDSGLSYSGIFLMFIGIVAIAFGSVLVRYSRTIG